MTEQMLISRLKHGDLEAFRAVFSKYRSKVFFFSYSYLKSESKAEDIVQDVFAKIWEIRSQLNEQSSFSNFLFTITKNTVLNNIRKTKYEIKYRQNQKELSHLSSSQENETLDSVMSNDMESYINTEIEKLPPAMRQIYKLSRIHLLSNQEIADRQNLSVRTVENQIYRAVSELKRKLIKESRVPDGL